MTQKKMFPLLIDDSNPPSPNYIPWSVAEKAYSQDRANRGHQSLERIAERGGYGPEEMDALYPDWRKEVEEIEILRAELKRLRKQIQNDWDSPDCRTLTQQINAAPKKLRTYIHDVVTRASTADLVQDNIALKDTADALKIENDRLVSSLDLFVDAAEKVEQADKLGSVPMLKLACVFVLKVLAAHRGELDS